MNHFLTLRGIFAHLLLPFRIPFYGYIRLLFFLYLILPQTQGARLLYEDYIHPFLEENEAHIDEFIASAHERLKAAGIDYFRRAIEYLKVNVLGLPPSDPQPPTPQPSGTSSAQGYTQSLLARFSIPTAKWADASSVGSDFYGLLASAVSAAAGVGIRGESGADVTSSGKLIPPHLRDSGEKMSFITAQRERLNIVLTALDREVQKIQRAETLRQSMGDPLAYNNEEEEVTQRPPSGLSVWSGLSKSRSETDFEKIDAESGAEDEGNLRRRHAAQGDEAGGGSWMPWGWTGSPDAAGKSSSQQD